MKQDEWSAKIFEHEGFDYFFTDYFSPESTEREFGKIAYNAHKAYLSARNDLLEVLKSIGIREE